MGDDYYSWRDRQDEYRREEYRRDMIREDAKREYYNFCRNRDIDREYTARDLEYANEETKRKIKISRLNDQIRGSGIAGMEILAIRDQVRDRISNSAPCFSEAIKQKWIMQLEEIDLLHSRAGIELHELKWNIKREMGEISSDLAAIVATLKKLPTPVSYSPLSFSKYLYLGALARRDGGTLEALAEDAKREEEAKKKREKDVIERKAVLKSLEQKILSSQYLNEKYREKWTKQLGEDSSIESLWDAIDRQRDSIQFYDQLISTGLDELKIQSEHLQRRNRGYRYRW